MKSLVDGALGIEGQLSVDFGGDLAGNDLQNFFAKLHKKAIQREIDLLVNGLAVLLAIGDSNIDQGGILGLLGSGQDQGGVGGGILGLVLADGCHTSA